MSADLWQKMWGDLQHKTNVVNSKYRFEGKSPFYPQWLLGKEWYQQGYDRDIKCHYLVPGRLWDLAHYFFQQQLIESKNPAYGTHVGADLRQKLASLGSQVGLYWSPSQEKYVPVEYKLEVNQGTVRFVLTTSTGKHLTLSLYDVCTLGQDIMGSLK